MCPCVQQWTSRCAEHGGAQSTWSKKGSAFGRANRFADERDASSEQAVRALVQAPARTGLLPTAPSGRAHYRRKPRSAQPVMHAKMIRHEA